MRPLWTSDRTQTVGNSPASEASSSATVVPQAISIHLSHRARPKFQAQTALPPEGEEEREGVSLPNPKPSLGISVCTSMNPIHKGVWHLRQELWPVVLGDRIRTNLKASPTPLSHTAVSSQPKSCVEHCNPVAALSETDSEPQSVDTVAVKPFAPINGFPHIKWLTL